MRDTGQGRQRFYTDVTLPVLHSGMWLPSKDYFHTGLLNTPTQMKKTLFNLFIVIKVSAIAPFIRIVHYFWSSSTKWL